MSAQRFSRASALFATLFLVAASAIGAPPITLRLMAGAGFGIPPKEATDPRGIARRAVFDEFRRRNPDIHLENAGGLDLIGQQSDSVFLMSMAGANAPDIFYVNFRQYTNFIDQGFCRPLDDFVAREPSVLAAKSPVVLKVLRSVDGHIYAIPFWQVALGLFYRKDFFAEAGLDPASPPKTWDELIEKGRRIVESSPGRFAYSFSKPPGYLWSNFVYQAGGEIVGQDAKGNWQSRIATPEVARAVDMYRRLILEKWRGKDGKEYGPLATISEDYTGDQNRGRVAMWLQYTSDVSLTSSASIPPSILGLAAAPAGPGGSQSEINAGSWAINARITDPAKLEACWRYIKFFAGDDAARVNTQRFVELGMADQVNPAFLQKFGFGSLVSRVDPSYLKASEDAFKNGHPEPYGRNCQQVYTILDEVLDRARLEPGTPAIEILREGEKKMNAVLLGYRPPEVRARQRVWTSVVLISLATIGMVAVGWWGRKVWVHRQTPIADSRKMPAFAWLCLTPAILSILTWAYYPLVRGLVMAFQDYRIQRGVRWVGVDNFVDVFTQPVFYQAILHSFVYVGLTLIIGFFLPLALALALSMIPRFGTFFRVVFYLPAMTSPIVISLLWRQFYDKTDAGLLNQLLAPLVAAVNPILGLMHVSPLTTTHDWLGDPSLAMLAVVLPGIWAGAGPGSVLYLAALKNIPAERYEAADLDGATWLQKILRVTVPSLRPLIMINLLGAFIGGFKATENIFVLTMGGPLGSTNTIGLEVWRNAFMFLKFGYATAAAWVMGAILVGFTVLQIRSLTRVRFGTARL